MLGDVNGDAYPDIAVGAPSGSGPPSVVRLFFGGPAALPDATTDGTLVGAAAGSFGLSIAGAGDVNGDGFQDLVVGDPASSSGASAIYVYFGGAGATFEVTPDMTASGRGGDSFGASVY